MSRGSSHDDISPAARVEHEEIRQVEDITHHLPRVDMLIHELLELVQCVSSSLGVVYQVEH